jgi:hypothetical protein
MNSSLMVLQKSRCILARIFAGEHEHHVAHRRQERIVVDSGVMSRGKNDGIDNLSHAIPGNHILIQRHTKARLLWYCYISIHHRKCLTGERLS